MMMMTSSVDGRFRTSLYSIGVEKSSAPLYDH